MKPSLENFQHYFASMWDECNCVVVLAFFGIVFLWDWNETAVFSKFDGIFNIIEIQAYVPTNNAEEAEVEWFYEDLQDLLELTPKKMSFPL